MNALLIYPEFPETLLELQTCAQVSGQAGGAASAGADDGGGAAAARLE